jgi:threonine/homoserine/homoserine lactone efflux protein
VKAALAEIRARGQNAPRGGRENPSGDRRYCFDGAFMNQVTFLAFAIVSFIGIATPGPTVLLALTNGSRFGVRRACFGMMGAMLSDFVLIGAVGLGLDALLAASQFWLSAVKWIGVGYLAYLGLLLLHSEGTVSQSPQAQSAGESGAARSVFLKCFLVAVTNPKGYLFFSAFLPQFVAPSAPQAAQYLILALIFTSIDFLVMFGYAMLGARAIRVLKRSGALWLDRLCGAALLTLAGSLAFYRRASA